MAHGALTVPGEAVTMAAPQGDTSKETSYD